MRYVIFIFVLALLTSFSNESVAQNKITVKGVVRDRSTGAVKPDVTISAGKPPKAIAKTDAGGAFSVTVDAGTELVFSHASFASFRKTAVGNDNSFDISIAPASDPMKEVVVQGFRTRSRETSTGSSTVLSGKTIQDVPVSNVTELLQGKVAGLNVQNNTGSPGAMGTINLRGVSSVNISADGFLTPTSPLFVIDGVPVDANTNYEYGFQGGGPGISPLSLIPPEDIEQFDILKDAAATSQYGSRGAYGVILITTRRGNSKVPIVQYSSNIFVKSPPQLRQVVGGRAERDFRINQILNYDTSMRGALALINNTPFLSDSLNPFYNNSTNWQNYFFRSTFNQTHNLSIRGGDNTFNYKTNLNYYAEDGIVQNTGFKRYSLGMNALYQPTTAFKMLVNLTSSLGEKENGSGVGLVQTGVAQSVATSSLLPPPSLFSENSAALATSRVKNQNKTGNLATTLELQYDIVEGIRLGNLLSYAFESGTADNFVPSFLNNGSSESYNYNHRKYNLYNRSTINFVKTLGAKNNLSGYVFNEINSTGFRASAISLGQTAHDQIQGPIGYNWTATRGGTLNNISDTRQHGYGGSVSYNYDRKYVIDFSYRFDGLSTNGPSTGYSQNPAVSARWNFNREPFFDNLPWLQYGSLRASWGRNIKPTGSIFDVYGKYIVGLPYNNNPTVTIDYGVVPNIDFLPETQTTSNVALEFGLFNGLLENTFETYYRSIDNQVISIDLANVNGFSKLKTNAISLVNYGFEWRTNLRLFNPKASDGFKSNITLTGALNRDVMTRLPNGLRQMTIQIQDGGGNVPVVYKIGRNSLSNLVYHTQGVYSNTSAVPVNMANGQRQQLGAGSGFYFQGGDPRWTDVNGDYIIDENDLLPIGNPVPRITGGISSLSSYKGFQLNVNVTYTLFRDLLNTSNAKQFQNYNDPTAINSMLPIDNFNYWAPSNDPKATQNAQYPNPYDFRRAGTLQPFRTNQTLFLEDGSYWKINNIILGYNFKPAAIKRFGMTSCRLNFTANNVYTFSNYSGPDPELVTALGRDASGGYPTARSYAFGVNVQF